MTAGATQRGRSRRPTRREPHQLTDRSHGATVGVNPACHVKNSSELAEKELCQPVCSIPRNSKSPGVTFAVFFRRNFASPSSLIGCRLGCWVQHVSRRGKVVLQRPGQGGVPRPRARHRPRRGAGGGAPRPGGRGPRPLRDGGAWEMARGGVCANARRALARGATAHAARS